MASYPTPTEGARVARCNCNPSGAPCLSAQPGNTLSLDSNGCLFNEYQAEALTGQTALTTQFDLVSVADGAYTAVPGLTATIPSAGTWEVIADVSASVHVDFAVPTPPASGTNIIRVFQRLYNTNTNSPVAGSDRAVIGIGSNQPGRFAATGEGTGHSYVTVTGPTTFQVYVLRTVTQVSGSTVTVINTTAILATYSQLRWHRLG